MKSNYKNKNELRNKIIKSNLFGLSFFSITILLASCSIGTYEIPNNLLSQHEKNKNTEFINNLSLSIKYRNVFSPQTIFSGTGYILDSDLANDSLPDNDIKSLRHYYLITNTHVLDKGYDVIQGGANTPINEAIETSIAWLSLGQSTIDKPDATTYTNWMFNINDKFKVMGLGINMKSGTWRDVEVLRVSLSKEETQKLPQFKFYEENKDKIKFNNIPLITNQFLQNSQQPEVTAGGYPYKDNILPNGGWGWVQFKQKNNYQWFIGKLKTYVNNDFEFNYNAIDYSVLGMNMNPGSSGSLAVLNNNDILGNYWGTVETTNSSSNQKVVQGLVTPYIAEAKMYKFYSNIYNTGGITNDKRTITFANFSDSPIIIPSISNFTVDLKGKISSTNFEKYVNNYQNLINLINLFVDNFYQITPNIDPSPNQPSYTSTIFPKELILNDIRQTMNDIPEFKIENASIKQNIIKDWKELSKNIYSYNTFLNKI